LTLFCWNIVRNNSCRLAFFHNDGCSREIEYFGEQDKIYVLLYLLSLFCWRIFCLSAIRLIQTLSLHNFGYLNISTFHTKYFYSFFIASKEEINKITHFWLGRLYRVPKMFIAESFSYVNSNLFVEILSFI